MNRNRYRSILLINPHNTLPTDSLRRIAIPLGLLYIGAVLKQNGFIVSILDSTCEGYYNTKEKDGYITYGLSNDEMIKHIRSFSPDLVGIQSMFSAHQENALDICNTYMLLYQI